LKTEEGFSVVLCGHSQGGSLALKCAELIATENLPFFKERCTVISLAPFPALETDILFSQEVKECKNVHVYFTAVQTNGHVYVDPWYFENAKKRKHYLPLTLLLLDKTVKEVVTEDFHPANDHIQGLFNHDMFDSLHSLFMYLNFFQLRTIAGGRRKSRRSRRSKTTYRPSRKVIIR
jgi:hypothetical protein